MKTKILTVLIFFLYCSMNAFSQFILAGTSGTNDYNFDINPDISIFANDPNGSPYYDYPNDTGQFLINVNGDNINDFKLTALYRNGTKWYQRFYSYITPLNNNQVAISNPDSCFNFFSEFQYLTLMVKPFSPGDSINKDVTWTDTTAYLAYQDENANYTFCFDNAFPINGLYAGVKVFIPNDTLYGWIEIRAAKYDSLIVKGFACNIFSTGIANYQTKSFFDIYPNPASDHIYLHLSPGILIASTDIRIEICNSLGQKVGESRVPSGQDVITFDVCGLSNGLYVMVLKENQRVISIEKFLIAQ